MLKVVKKVQENEDLVLFVMEDSKQDRKEFYVYANSNGILEYVVIIDNDTNKRRELKADRFTKKYFEVVCKWIEEEEKKLEEEKKKIVEEVMHDKMLKEIRNVICYGVEENIEQSIKYSNGLDYFAELKDKYVLYQNEQDGEKKLQLEENLMHECVEVYSVLLYQYTIRKRIKLESFMNDSDGALNMYIKDMNKKGYEVDFYNLGNSFDNEYEYLIMILIPIEKNNILQLVDSVMNEENSIDNFDNESEGIRLLDELEKKLSSIFGSNETYRILDTVVCRTSIEKEDRLRIMDSILSIKGIN